MITPEQFPILKRWPAKHPDRLQLFSLPTPNGVKVSMCLEEVALPYEAHWINILDNETWTDEFLSLNPNGKIPAIIDPQGANDKPLGLWESGAILVYLAEKTGRLLPKDLNKKYEVLQWVFFQMGGVGPIFGQVGFFHCFAGKDIEDKRPLNRYVNESKRVLQLLDNQLSNNQWVAGNEFTIADLSMLGWVETMNGFYNAGDLVDYDSLIHIHRWIDECNQRPAVQRGKLIPEMPS